jgi:hypothetical protein
MKSAKSACAESEVRICIELYPIEKSSAGASMDSPIDSRARSAILHLSHAHPIGASSAADRSRFRMSELAR